MRWFTSLSLRDAACRTSWASTLAMLCAIGIAGATGASAQELAPIPPLSSRVTDVTGTLGVSAKQSLDTKLQAFEQATGGQLAVLIVKTAEPETIDQYGIRVGEAWKIGKKGKDTGAILIVAMKEKKLRIEVGYGWEGALPDVEAKRIIRETITPFFKQSQFVQGLDAGIDKIQLAVSNDVKAASTTVDDKGQWTQSHNPSTADATLESLLGLAPVLLGVVAVLSFILPALLVGLIAGGGAFFFTSSLPAAGIAAFSGFVGASILRGLFGSLRGMPLGGNRIYRSSGGLGSSSWGSGSWSSGGGGGFSGGGGSFGGGGASGGWGGSE